MTNTGLAWISVSAISKSSQKVYLYVTISLSIKTSEIAEIVDFEKVLKRTRCLRSGSYPTSTVGSDLLPRLGGRAAAKPFGRGDLKSEISYSGSTCYSFCYSLQNFNLKTLKMSNKIAGLKQK